MVGQWIRGWRVAFGTLGLGAIGCQLALDFDYQFEGAAGASGIPEYGGAGGRAAADGGAGGGAGSGVSEQNGGGDGVDTYGAGSGPVAGGASGAPASGSGGASSASGSGGAPNTSGTGGAPSANAGTAGASTSTAGAGGSGDEPPPPCSGCVELIVPFSDVPAIANFQIEIAEPDPALDFTAGAIEWTVRALALDPELGLEVSAQNGAELGYVGLYTEPAVPLVEPDFGPGVWTTLRLDVGAFSATGENVGAASDHPELFDVTRLRVLGLELGVRSDAEGPFELHLLIDRVTLSGVPGVDVFEFSDGLDGFVLELAPEGTQVIHHPADAG